MIEYDKETYLKLEFVKESLHYDPITGIFIWKRNGRGNHPGIGGKAGSYDVKGYIS